MENLEQLAANQDQSEPQQKLSINPSTQQYRVGKINTLTNNNEIHDNKPSHIAQTNLKIDRNMQ